VYQCLLDKEWETRNAAGKALEAIAANLTEWQPLPDGDPLGTLLLE
jgi:hypothetical protein